MLDLRNILLLHVTCGLLVSPLLVVDAKTPAKVDLNFILEHTSYVDEASFNLEMGFVRDVVDAVDIGTSLAQVSVSTAETGLSVHIHLNDYDTVGPLNDAIASIPYLGMNTLNIRAVLSNLNDNQNFVNTDEGWRPSVDNYIIMVLSVDSDIEMFNAAKTASQVHQYYNIIMIGVGSSYSPSLFRVYASSPLLHFHIDSFEDLDTLVPTISMLGYHDVPIVDSFTANSGASSITVAAGTRVEFYCKAMGNPFPELYITSQFGEGAVQSEPPAYSGFIKEVYGVKVMTLGKSDVFYCNAANNQGPSADRTIRVMVKGPPTVHEMSTTEFITSVSELGDVSISFPVNTHQDPTGYTLAHINIPAVPGSAPTSTVIPAGDFTATFTRQDIRHGVVELSFNKLPYKAVNEYDLKVENDEGDLHIFFKAIGVHEDSSDGLDTSKVGFYVGFAIIGLVLLFLLGFVAYGLKKLATLKRVERPFPSGARPMRGSIPVPGQFNKAYGRPTMYY